MDLLVLIEKLKDEISKAVAKSRNSLSLDFAVPEVNIEIPAQSIHGELSTNVSMVCARLFRKPPIEIARLIASNLPSNEYVSKCEVAGNGFINFFLSQKFFSDVIFCVDSNYGKVNYGKGKRVLVEFVSSNPTGPMHMGNARLGALGDSLSEVLEYAGYDVCKEFYINDAGNQIKKFSESLASRYLQIFNSDEKFPADGYQGNDIKELAFQFEKIHGNSLVNSERSYLEKRICMFALPRNIWRIKSNLENYKVFYDNWFQESSLYESGEVNDTIQKMKDMKVTYSKDEGLWFKATDFGCHKDEVLVRSNGTPTYFASDIAYHVNKFLKRKYDICIDFLGADHHGHIPRMRASMRCFGIDDSRLIFIISQFVRLVKDGKANAMSKRSGKSETLEDFLKLVDVDCARFIFNMQDADSTMDFDIDLAIKNDSSNPAYYVKYAYARIRSILDKISNVNFDKLNLDLLRSESEKDLIFALSEFPLEIKESARLLDSTRIVRYVMKLASIFHKFYNSERVNCENMSLRSARCFLCLKTSIVMKSVLDIIKVDAPEHM